MSEKVNHPDHYNISGRKECIVEMEERFGVDAVITFCKLNAYKYRYRHTLKGGQEDLDKAKWYENYMRRLDQDVTDINVGKIEVEGKDDPIAAAVSRCDPVTIPPARS